MHEPFPIADFREGLSLPKEPWLSPVNAFRTLENGRVFRGRLEKREGFKFFRELAAGTADTAGLYDGFFLDLSVTPSVKYYSYKPTVPNIDDKPNLASIWFRSDNGVAGAPYINAVTDVDNLMYIPASAGASGPGWEMKVVDESDPTIVLGWARLLTEASSGYYLTAAVAWQLHSGYSADPTNDGELFYRLNPRTSVIGLVDYNTSSGDFTLAADQNFLYKYNGNKKYFEEQGGVIFDTPSNFSGGDDDYFWFWPFDDYILFTNGIDPVCRWDPTEPAATSISEQPTDFDLLGSNDIDTALLIIRFKGRAVYLHTTESATVYPRRARFSAAGAYDTFDSALDFLDAPAELGAIVTAQFIGERCFVGFEDGWMELVHTGDAIQPFEWRPFISRFGAVSKLSTIQDNERLLSRSQTTMQALDPNGQIYLDDRIPDFVRNFSATKTSLCASARNEDQRSFWWTYVSSIASVPDNILSATYDEVGNLSWSTYDFAFNVFSTFKSESQPSWNSLGPLTWNQYSNVTWNDARVGIEGFVQVIAGGKNGAIYVMSPVNVDQYLVGEQQINMNFSTQRLAPYPGSKAHLGWVDIYADSTGILTLEFFVDSESAPHMTKTVDFSTTGSASKVIRRVRVGRTGTFHTIKGSTSDGSKVSIDAIVPWFRQAGRMRGFN